MESCFEHYGTLRKEVGAWLAQSRQMDPPSRHGGGEDEANYSLAWFPHYLLTGSEEVKAHFEYLRDLLAGWVERDCLHGYEPEAEAHHGTEPFLLFLPRHLGLFPDDEEARGLLEDAAHHIGNWVEEIPAWFNWDRNRFFGYQIGTRTVEQDPGKAVEMAEHFRFIHIALAAHRVLGEDRYLDWALRYGRRRAEMIVAVPEGPLPSVWDADGQPVWETGIIPGGTPRDPHPVHRVDEPRIIPGEGVREMRTGGHHAPGDPLSGVEMLLASGAIYALGDLFMASGEDVFRKAARRIAEPLVGELLDPYVDPGAAAVSYYRRAFGDDMLDGAIRETIAAMPPEQEGELAMTFPEVRRRSWPGVGKRSDMVFWGVWNDADGSIAPVREPCTAALTLAYQMTGDVDYARRALKQAAARLMMARRVLRGGREHSDMGGAVCSVAAGHGRNWGWGAVTGCYGPLTLGTWEVQGAVRPLAEVRQTDGKPGLPNAVLSLVIPPEFGDGKVQFFNGGDKEARFSWRQDDGAWKEMTLGPGETVTSGLTESRKQ